MKKLLKCLLIAPAAVLFSCEKKPETEVKKVRYEDASKVKPQPVKRDGTGFRIADLPVQIPGTKYLIFPVGDIRAYDGNAASSFEKSANVSFTISNYDREELTGNFTNLRFQHQDSLATRALTGESMLIQSVSYLGALASKSRLQILVYALFDKDTNQDGKLDANDVKSLYISDVSGLGLTKLSADTQELIDWTLMEPKSSMYFRSIEDANKNGSFDKGDKVHHYFVNLSDKEWTPQEFDPMQ